MKDVIQNTLVVQAKTGTRKGRPAVYRTIARACNNDFNIEKLFEQHDLVCGNEVELHLGIVE
jgi:hypothetical protein